ncbi:MAG: hypothetical protein U5L09_06935 [Bacteroidales bacterium]|nr:hypothetical protein [Bacteroidales bacterium]
MPTDLLVVLLPPLLLVAQATLNVPQLVRLFRAQHAGVPLAGEAMSLLAGAGWLVWAVLAGDGLMVVSAVLALAGFGPSTWVLLRAGRPWRLATSLVAAAALGAGVGLLVGGVTLLGGVLTGLAVVQCGAYLTEAVRCPDWSGYSPTSGVLRIGFGAGSGAYGYLHATPALVVWGALTVVTFTATYVRATWWRRTRSGPRRPWAAPLGTPARGPPRGRRPHLPLPRPRSPGGDAAVDRHDRPGEVGPSAGCRGR